jgi:hypothetical protein
MEVPWLHYVSKLLCWRRFALRLFLSEQSQQHFLSGRGILRALGEQLYIKRDVFVVGIAWLSNIAQTPCSK